MNLLLEGLGCSRAVDVRGRVDNNSSEARALRPQPSYMSIIIQPRRIKKFPMAQLFQYLFTTMG